MSPDLWEHEFRYFLFSRWAIAFHRFAEVSIGIGVALIFYGFVARGGDSGPREDVKSSIPTMRLKHRYFWGDTAKEW